MVTVPEPIALPYGFETRLTCEMNIQPDRFQWKFYPTNEPYNPKALIDLGNGTFHLIPENKYTNQGRKSLLSLLVRWVFSKTDFVAILISSTTKIKSRKKFL